MGSSSTSRLTPLMRWLGLTLVVVMILQKVYVTVLLMFVIVQIQIVLKIL